MLEIGRVCIKIAGRDAGNTCIIVDNIDEKTVLIDGNVRRRKCNIKHLEPLKDVIKIKKGAPTSEIHKAMVVANIKVIEKKRVKRSPKKEETKERKTRKKDGK
jgi:large subunit ribosomal protein L14e